MSLTLEQLREFTQAIVGGMAEQLRPVVAAAATAGRPRHDTGLKGFKLNVPKYDGRTGDVMQFVEQIRDLRALKRTSAADAVIAYRSLWTEKGARNVVQASLRENHDLGADEQLERLEAALISKFSPNDPIAHYKDKLLSLKQELGESVKDYDSEFASCIEALDNYGHVLPDDDKKHMFRRGLVKSLRLAVVDFMDKDATFAELRKFVTKHETHHGVGLRTDDEKIAEKIAELCESRAEWARSMGSKIDEMGNRLNRQLEAKPTI